MLTANCTTEHITIDEPDCLHKPVFTERAELFRGQLNDYVRLYAFLAQVLTFKDVDLEKLYVFGRHLRRLLPADPIELTREVQQNINMESYRIQQTSSGRIALDRKAGILDPQSSKGRYGPPPEEMETLSSIKPSSTNASGSISAPNTG